MRRIFLLLICIFSLSAILLMQLRNNLADADTLQDTYVWDFGQVKEGEILRHEFTLKNDAPEILNIREFNTSCGCTAAEVKKKSLLPGEETTIEVKFNTKGYSGQTKQHVYVRTDNLDKEIFEYTITAKVIRG